MPSSSELKDAAKREAKREAARGVGERIKGAFGNSGSSSASGINDPEHRANTTTETYQRGRQAQRDLEKTAGMVRQGYDAAVQEVKRGQEAARRAAEKKHAQGLSYAMGQGGGSQRGAAQDMAISNASQNQALAAANIAAGGAGQIADLRIQGGRDISQDARDVIQSRIHLQEYLNSIATLPEQEQARLKQNISELEGLYSAHGKYSSFSREKVAQLLAGAITQEEKDFYQSELDRIDNRIQRQNALSLKNNPFNQSV